MNLGGHTMAFRKYGMDMNYLDLFGGIGGFHLGLTQGGVKFDWTGFSEIDRWAKQVYQKHFPETEDLGDVRTIRPDTLPKIDMLTFGFPCQDLSVAGKRKGIHAKRSGLFFEAMRIVRATLPSVFVFENVPGLFSSNSGEDFTTILREIANIGLYECEWQVIDTAWFLPQSRKRIYFIGIRKDLQFKSIFPIIPDKHIGEVEYEKVYEVPEGVSKIIKVFLERQEIQGQSNEVVSELFQRIHQSILQGESKEIEGDTAEVRQVGKENISEIETFQSVSDDYDNEGRFYSVVQIPTEKMLLLWHRGNTSSFSFRFTQPEDTSFDYRQDRPETWIRKREHGSLLLAVQLYKGRLFYSCGDGRNWTKIYIQEVGKCRQTLSDILEENPDPKYFLSEKAVMGILKHQERHQKKKQGFGAIIHHCELGEEIIRH